MRLRLVTFLAALAAVAATGCGALPDEATQGVQAADGRLQAVTTTNWITDTAEQIGGDRVAVTGLMGAGVDPHLYNASAGDVDTLRETDVAFWNGLDLEAQMEDVFETIGEEKPVVAVGEAIPEQALLSSADQSDEPDPHVWFSPDRWKAVATAMARTYTEADPEGASTYEANLEAFLAQLDAVDAYAQERFAQIPEKSRVLVTSHDAFTYFGDEYGFDVVAIQGISTQDEATPGDIERVAATIAERDLDAVFVESSVPRRTIEAVIAAAAQQGQPVEVGGELFGDNAGDRGTPGGTYIGALRQNIDLIADGLS
ncbi:MAG: zinc ABC transporter substrate-binding protein [Solirubrobacteraceae bacterium MAG38_C4-C5]|nr:zinc ABC transporter substrate-binding protein [Candidatus Siliceabacter maunaloa]